MRILVLALAFACSGCQSLWDVDSEVVNTPLHDDTRVFYFGKAGTNDPTYAAVPLVRSNAALPENDPTLVEHGDPVSIIVNRVVLPKELFDTTAAEAANRRNNRKTYDIAVVVDIAAVEGQDKESIAVFYQRGVKADTALTFDGLLVYNQDTWDNRVPPYFRVRIFNVSNERNQATRDLLAQVSEAAPTLLGLVGMPGAEPLIGFATRAAELITTGRNEMLVDFQFQLYSTAQTSESGGMPLNVFRKGGLLIVGVPRDHGRDYWRGANLTYDMTTDYVSNNKAVMDVPFLSATVITTDAVVPSVVKKRSAEIFEILRDTDALTTEFGPVLDSLSRLSVAVTAMKAREKFAANPTVTNLEAYVDSIANSAVGDAANQLSPSVHNWLIATVRTATGVRLSTIAEYKTWIAACKDKVTFKPNQRRFLTEDAEDADCKSGKAGASAADADKDQAEQ